MQAIRFVTSSCTGCAQNTVEGGVMVSLVPALGHGGCQTLGLDDPDTFDYSPGLEAAFSSLAEGMAGCFEAALPGGPVAGNVTWTGSGVWAARARAVCVDLELESWCCEMESGTAPQNEPVALGNCDQEQLL